MLALLGGFGLTHSGLASLRMTAEKKLGARLYRVIFALASITAAVIVIGYFLKHRYDGVLLWQLQGTPGLKSFVWALSAISLFFSIPLRLTCWKLRPSKSPRCISTKRVLFASVAIPKW